MATTDTESRVIWWEDEGDKLVAHAGKIYTNDLDGAYDELRAKIGDAKLHQQAVQSRWALQPNAEWPLPEDLPKEQGPG